VPARAVRADRRPEPRRRPAVRDRRQRAPALADRAALRLRDREADPRPRVRLRGEARLDDLPAARDPLLLPALPRSPDRPEPAVGARAYPDRLLPVARRAAGGCVLRAARARGANAVR